MSRLRTVRHIFGTIAPAVHRLVATALDETVDEGIGAAVSAWQADGWLRYDDHEANCTIQLYRCLEESIRRIPRLRLLSARLEWVQPTPQMYAGIQSATKTSRPDLRLSIGRDAGITLECKRLSLGEGHPRNYVYEGMNRFVSGNYSASETRGGMVGYVQADAPAEILLAVNVAVAGHPSMGAGHELQPDASIAAVTDRYKSSHDRASLSGIELTHYWLDMGSGSGPEPA
jgi:hypothetical protein